MNVVAVTQKMAVPVIGDRTVVLVVMLRVKMVTTRLEIVAIEAMLIWGLVLQSRCQARRL